MKRDSQRFKIKPTCRFLVQAKGLVACNFNEKMSLFETAEACAGCDKYEHINPTRRDK